VKQLLCVARRAQLNPREPVGLHNIETGTVMPKTIRFGRRLLRRTTCSMPAPLALRRRSGPRTQTIRANRRATERINQRQRQNRRHKSRPHCASGSHKTNYSTAPHPPEAAALGAVRKQPARRPAPRLSQLFSRNWVMLSEPTGASRADLGDACGNKGRCES